jgi:hypothetical protein
VPLVRRYLLPRQVKIFRFLLAKVKREHSGQISVMQERIATHPVLALNTLVGGERPT